MATSKSEISLWFDIGEKLRHTHMIVVCDTFDWEDYPVYVTGDEKCLKSYADHNGPNMQKVMEVYDLRLDKNKQLDQSFVMNLPKKR